MMKKTLGFLAALTLAASSALPAFADAAGYEDESYESSFGSQQEAGGDFSLTDVDWLKECTDYAEEHEDPMYGRLNQMYEDALEAGEQEDSGVSAANRELDAGAVESVPFINDTLYHSSRFDGQKRTYGIDVSYYQRNIDWNRVKAAGIDYAIIRVGYRGWGSAGTLVTDENFYTYLKGAKAAGLKVGVYFFTQAITTEEAREEAKYVLSRLDGESLDMPVYFDTENSDNPAEGRADNAGLTKSSRTKICRAFCDTINDAGYTAGIYASKYWLTYEIDGDALGDDYPIWLAHYTRQTDYSGEYGMWQFTGSGSVDGISVAVDCNVLYGDYSGGGSGMPITLSKPQGLSFSNNGGKSKLTWNAVDNAQSYEVCTYDSETGKYNVKATVNSTSWETDSPDSSAYCVRAVAKQGSDTIYSEYSDTVYLSNTIVKNISASLSGNTIALTWDSVPNANGYAVFRSTDGSNYTQLDMTISNRYNDTAAQPGNKYYYKVQALFGDLEYEDKLERGTMSDKFVFYTAPTAPAALKFTGCTDKTVDVEWSAVKNVTGYQVLWKNPDDNKYTLKADVKSTAKLKATVKNLSAGSSNDLYIRTYVTNGSENIYSSMSPVLTVKTAPAAAKGLTASLDGKYVKLTWNSVQGADKYAIYRTVNGKQVKLGESPTNGCKILVTGVSTRVYSVKGIVTQNGISSEGASSSKLTVKLVSSAKKPDVPAIASAEYKDSAVTLKWNKASGAKGYRIYEYDAESDTYKKVKTVSGGDTTSCKLKAEPGLVKAYKIKSYSRSSSGVALWCDGASPAYIVKTYSPSAPSLSVVNTTSNSITFSWNVPNGASGIRLYMRDPVTGKYKSVKTRSSSKTSYTVEGLSSGSTYSFKIKAYRRDGDNLCWGKASSAFTVQTNW